jgi:tetratricopeptide (TPR) repeat protein
MGQTGPVPTVTAPSATQLWERAVATSRRGGHAAAVALIERALRAPDLDDAVHLRCVVTLALARSELEGVDVGLETLEGARHLLAAVDPAVQGAWHCQRALMLLRAGRLQEAGPEFDRGAALAQDRDLVLCYLNRGVLHLRTGEVGGALADFRSARASAEEAGLDIEAAKAVGNLGYVAFLRGDLPEALRLAQRAREVLGPLGPWLDGISAKGLGEMLLAAGLLGESEAQYRSAVRSLRGSSHRQDRGEAQLGLAEIARLRGQWTTARASARRAQQVFTGRGATGWALLAELELTRADCATRPAKGAPAAADLADRLEQQGMREEAAVARLLRASALLRLGRTQEAATSPRGRWAPPGARVSTRMLAHETRAAVLTAARGPAAAQRVRLAGLRDLQDVQARFGSLDLLTSATRIGLTLATDGLGQALRRGRVDDVLLWSEQVRATGHRVRPVRPPQDERVAELLARLRFLQGSEQAERLATGRADPTYREQVRAVQAEVRQRSWEVDGAGEVLGPVGTGELQAALDGSTLVSLMTVDDRVHALVVGARSSRLLEVGSARQVREDVLRVRADLDLLAGSALPKPLRDSVSASLGSGLRRLADLAAPALAGTDGPVVLVPSGQSALVPWSMLAPLRGREVSVAPSATWWAAARSRPARADGSTVLVCGPDVARGEPEVRAASQGTDAVVLAGGEATTASTLAAMDGAAVLHVAAHGRHEPDNPLFSSLLLHDGWLFGHDLDAVRQLPEHVVLSACETGMASIRPGDEALGMTAALLHGGTRAVVGAVARVGDEVAEQVAVRHHAGLRAGLTPAAALTAAVADLGDDAVAPLVCFGAG